ncbi:Gfo/Idh/MocA family protein [Paenarthrobacter sp. NPDC092416]|uniref:Gfo/Idh/MocA family protein n=1 Tax=Paenarthrobacter sp. NPDC092416 TaxID=3364386 RepID=UPI0038027EB4
MNNINIGIIGASAIAPLAVSEPAALLPEVTVAAVAARGQHRANDFAVAHDIETAYGTYEELIADPGIDAVYVATPNAAHFKWVMEAVSAGKNVLCEKPLAMNVEQAEQVRQAAEAAGLIVSEAFHYYYHPAFRRVLEIIRSGELGALQTAHIDFHFDARQRPEDIRWSAPLGGGALLDLGCYAVHAARSIFGSEPLSVDAALTLVESGVDGAVAAEMIFGPGQSCSFSCSLTSDEQYSELVIAGSEGSLTLNHPFTPHWGHELRMTTAHDIRTETTSLETTYLFQLREFAAAILGKSPLLLPLSDAVANARVLDSLFMAASRTTRATNSDIPR